MAKHAKAYAKLSQAEKERRYKDYTSAKSNPTKQTRTKKTAKVSKVKSVGGLSKCSTLYALALTVPWELQEPPCIPDSIPLPSFKFAGRVKTRMVIGTGGCGWATADPFVGSFTYPAGGVLPGTVVTTTAAAIFTNYVRYIAGPSFDIQNTDSPFVGDVQSIRQSRVVGAGLRIRYIGPELTRSGRIIIYRDADNNDMPAALTVPTMLLNKETVTVPVDREWHGVMFKPATFSDLSYLYPPNITGGLNRFSLLAFVEGAPVGSTFEVDFCAWYEMVGSSLPGYSTSHSDPAGMAAVSTVLATHQPEDDPLTYAASFFKKVAGVVGETLSYLPSAVGTGVKFIENVAPALAPTLRAAAPLALTML